MDSRGEEHVRSVISISGGGGVRGAAIDGFCFVSCSSFCVFERKRSCRLEHGTQQVPEDTKQGDHVSTPALVMNGRFIQTARVCVQRS